MFINYTTSLHGVKAYNKPSADGGGFMWYK